jgi:hypothetical protein
VTQQKHAGNDQATNSLDERRTMYFDAEADDVRVDAMLGELRLLPMLETTDATDNLEQQLRTIVRWRMEHNGDS